MVVADTDVEPKKARKSPRSKVSSAPQGPVTKKTRVTRSSYPGHESVAKEEEEASSSTTTATATATAPTTATKTTRKSNKRSTTASKDQDSKTPKKQKRSSTGGGGGKPRRFLEITWDSEGEEVQEIVVVVDGVEVSRQRR